MRVWQVTRNPRKRHFHAIFGLEIEITGFELDLIRGPNGPDCGQRQ
jgi:hypothetical protein